MMAVLNSCILSACVNFAAHIYWCTEIVGALCSSLMAFFEHVPSKQPFQTVEWYYGDAGSGHNNEDVCVLTQMPQNICTAT